MAWHMTGQLIDSCSCKLACPCILGAAQPDQGWCSGVILFDIQQGNSDGVSLDSLKVAFAIDLPGDFMSGNGTVRLYLDESANAAQRSELEALFQGKKGGPLEAIAGLVTKWLPTQSARIHTHMGDSPSITIGNVGQITLARVKTQDGRQTRLENPPALAPFGVQYHELARGDGSYMADPDMRRWVSGGEGGISPFNMSG